MILHRFGLLNDCWRVLDTRALLSRSHLLSIKVNELRAVGDRPDAVRLDLLYEGIAGEVHVLELFLFERGDLDTNTTSTQEVTIYESTRATKHAALKTALGQRCHQALGQRCLSNRWHIWLSQSHLLVEVLLIPIEDIGREVKVGKLLQRRVFEILPAVFRGLRVRPRAYKIVPVRARHGDENMVSRAGAARAHERLSEASALKPERSGMPSSRLWDRSRFLSRGNRSIVTSVIMLRVAFSVFRVENYDGGWRCLVSARKAKDRYKIVRVMLLQPPAPVRRGPSAYCTKGRAP